MRWPWCRSCYGDLWWFWGLFEYVCSLVGGGSSLGVELGRPIIVNAHYAKAHPGTYQERLAAWVGLVAGHLQGALATDVAPVLGAGLVVWGFKERKRWSVWGVSVCFFFWVGEHIF